MTAEFVAIDFETTGLSPDTPYFHRAVEVGIVRFSLESGIVAEYETVLNPERDIGAFEIHGITAELASTAPKFLEIAADLTDLLNGAILVAHNKQFDVRFLKAELTRAGITYGYIDGLCTMQLAGLLKPDCPRRLNQCCEALDIAPLPSHQALNDAKMTASITEKVLKEVGFPALTDVVKIGRPNRQALPPLRRGQHVPKTILQGTYLNHLMTRLTHQTLPINRMGIAVAEYLNLLEKSLEDRRIDSAEADSLIDLADRLEISRPQLEAIHATYFSSLCEHVLADGELSMSEEKDLEGVSGLLGITDWREIVNATTPRLPIPGAASRIQPGTSVCFTGSMRYPRQACIDLAEAAGLAVHVRVTKSLDILVVADPDSQSNKACKARDYGIRIVSESAFFSLLRHSPSTETAEPESVTSPVESPEFEIKISIGGIDPARYEAADAISAEQSVAEDEVRKLLRELSASELSLVDLDERISALRKSIPKTSTLKNFETVTAPEVRALLTDIYCHLQYLRENSNLVTESVQHNARFAEDTTISTLALLSLIPSLHKKSGLPDEVWCEYLTEDVKRALSNLRDSVRRLKLSSFLSAEALVDFTDPKIAQMLSGYSIVITGDFPEFSREEGRGAIMRRGGKSPTSVSGRTYALVVGEMPGTSKLQKALNLGIKVLTDEGFRRLLEQGPERTQEASIASKPGPVTKSDSADESETLVCRTCGSEFSRLRVKGRKPHHCSNCH
jgi:DNA polymerase-3 subunit epsilon